ncbi:MAG: glycosyltransferase [Acidobacteriota bacterium]
MKISILVVGTRGDVQPFLALGKALAARGHEVRLGGPDNFTDWVTSHGIDFHPTGIDMEAFLQSDEVKRVLGGNWLALGKIWRSTIIPMMRNILDATWEACRDADLILYHPKALGAIDVAEVTGAKVVCAAVIPMVPTAEFPPVIWTRQLGPFVDRQSHKLFNMSRVPYRKILDVWRRESLGLGEGLGWAPIGGTKDGLIPRLCAVSPAVLPRPADWDATAYMTGYWFLDADEDWRPDEDLAAFLDAGEPPVYIGFGSMTTRDPAATARTILEAVDRAGVRAIVATGWGGLAALAVPEHVHVIDGAPHDVLFRQVSAVVHHGGAGTTAAGLRAGRPTLICPVAVDQPFWGHRVWKLGCGPKPQPLRKLRVERLALGLIELTGTPAYRRRAEAIGEAIRAEDGIANAMRIIGA